MITISPLRTGRVTNRPRCLSGRDRIATPLAKDISCLRNPTTQSAEPSFCDLTGTSSGPSSSSTTICSRKRTRQAPNAFDDLLLRQRGDRETNTHTMRSTGKKVTPGPCMHAMCCKQIGPIRRNARPQLKPDQEPTGRLGPLRPLRRNVPGGGSQWQPACACGKHGASSRYAGRNSHLHKTHASQPAGLDLEKCR